MLTTLLLLCLAVLFGTFAMAFQVVRQRGGRDRGGVAAPAPLRRNCRLVRRYQTSARSQRRDRGRDIHSFEFYRHTAPGNPDGALVATEGGPGYPATLSRQEYLDLFAPLLASHDFVLMDNRGTGQSGALDCPALQAAPRGPSNSSARAASRLKVDLVDFEASRMRQIIGRYGL